jgi:hypothetical protein
LNLVLLASSFRSGDNAGNAGSVSAYVSGYVHWRIKIDPLVPKLLIVKGN